MGTGRHGLMLGLKTDYADEIVRLFFPSSRLLLRIRCTRPKSLSLLSRRRSVSDHVNVEPDGI